MTSGAMSERLPLEYKKYSRRGNVYGMRSEHIDTSNRK